MQCSNCHSIKNSVIDSRLTDNNNAIRRRRECDQCGNRFTTFERLRATNLMTIKKDQTREEYDREKLERGIWHACRKRPVNKNQIDEMLNKLEEQWAQKNEITTTEIGQGVLEGLKKIDPVAYIRFASVYQEFSDIKSFEDLIEKLG